MKLKNIVVALPSLQKLAAAELSRKTLYWVDKLIRKVDSETEFYDTERLKILTKYGVMLDDGSFRIKEDMKEAFKKEIDELLDIDVDFDIKPIILPADEDIKLSYNDKKALTNFVEIQFNEESAE